MALPPVWCAADRVRATRPRMARSHHDLRSHHILPGAAQAACGLAVTPSLPSSAEPTCGNCRRYLAFLDRMRSRLGDEDARGGVVVSFAPRDRAETGAVVLEFRRNRSDAIG